MAANFDAKFLLEEMNQTFPDKGFKINGKKLMVHSIKNLFRGGGWTNLSRFKSFIEKIRIPPGKMPKFAHTPWKEIF